MACLPAAMGEHNRPPLVGAECVRRNFEILDKGEYGLVSRHKTIFPMITYVYQEPESIMMNQWEVANTDDGVAVGFAQTFLDRGRLVLKTKNAGI